MDRSPGPPRSLRVDPCPSPPAIFLLFSHLGTLPRRRVDRLRDARPPLAEEPAPRPAVRSVLAVLVPRPAAAAVLPVPPGPLARTVRTVLAGVVERAQLVYRRGLTEAEDGLCSRVLFLFSFVHFSSVRPFQVPVRVIRSGFIARRGGVSFELVDGREGERSAGWKLTRYAVLVHPPPSSAETERRRPLSYGCDRGSRPAARSARRENLCNKRRPVGSVRGRSPPVGGGRSRRLRGRVSRAGLLRSVSGPRNSSRGSVSPPSADMYWNATPVVRRGRILWNNEPVGGPPTDLRVTSFVRGPNLASSVKNWHKSKTGIGRSDASS